MDELQIPLFECKDDFINRVRQIKSEFALMYARNRGIPYYEYTYEQKIIEFNKIKHSNFINGIENKEVLQYLHGIGLAWSYFPHHWEVRIANMKTPSDVFYNDELLKKALISRMKWGGDSNVKDNGYLSDAQLRKAIRTYSGVQAVSNFRPVAAASIYHHYAGDGVVWDMSCGFGGRLIGALASDAVKKYIGCDPSTPTFEGLLKIKSDFDFVGMNVEIHKCGSETFIPDCKVDLCFTSPPYFNTEKYTDEDTQSYKKFDSVINWNEGFLRQTVKNCYTALKENRYMLLNVANVKSHKTLELDTVRIAQEEGFVLHDTLKLRLSSLTKGGFKYEPIFVFTKVTK